MSKIAFSSMFADVTPPPALRAKMDGALLTGAAIDKTLRTIDLQMETRSELNDGDLKELSREICAVYGFTETRIKAVFRAPEPVREAERYAPQGAAEKKRDGAVKDVLSGWGAGFKDRKGHRHWKDFRL